MFVRLSYGNLGNWENVAYLFDAGSSNIVGFVLIRSYGGAYEVKLKLYGGVDRSESDLEGLPT